MEERQYWTCVMILHEFQIPMLLYGQELLIKRKLSNAFHTHNDILQP